MRLLCAIAVVLVSVLAPALAYADYDRSRKWFNSLSSWERRGIQINLISAGFYTGFADATFGRNTYSALVDFEYRHSIFPNGILTGIEAAMLVRIAQDWRNRLQVADARDERAGVALPVPYALVHRQEATERGALFAEKRSSLQVETMAFDGREASLDALYHAFTRESVSPGITYNAKRQDFFVVSGESGGVKYYTLMRNNFEFVSGFTVAWSSQIDDMGSRVAVYMASEVEFFRPRGGQLPSLLNEDSEIEGDDAPPAQSGVGSGSGFFVSSSGLILTNHHVVDGCDVIDVPRFGRAELLRADEAWDLAIILVTSTNQPTAMFAASSPPLGSEVILGGYPLSTLFDNDFKVAFGEVTGRRGFGGDERQFSISAPIQPGNSGGAIINNRGEVVGIAVSKLDDAKMIEVVGSTGANFSFAIDATRIGPFLRPFAMTIQESASGLTRGANSYDKETLVRDLESYSVQVICRRFG
ncbi:MAG: trypsin-like peptidase domain-containing protein [Rhizobiaceae bacterium]|nr:trypsin-like peptidase domain-containing protein [Rhizobiaceae bacterium]